MKIEDGAGTGVFAKVDNEQRLRVLAVSEPVDRHVNISSQGQWSISITVTPTGANDYFFYLKNTSASTAYAITDIRISSTVATEITYEHVSGTPTYSGATDAPITNRYLGSSRQPTVTCKYDTDITNLTSEGEIFFEECANADTRYKLSTSSNIIVPPGQAIAFKRVAATGAIRSIVSLTELG